MTPAGNVRDAIDHALRGAVTHDKHLRPGNALVHVPLDERIANRIVDRGQSPTSFLRT
jgi:hypothetical protein